MSMEQFNKTKSELENKIDEAQMTFDTEKLTQLQEQLAHLESTKNTYEEMSESATEIPQMKVDQITELGGSTEELNEKLVENTGEIEGVKEEVRENIDKKELKPEEIKDIKKDFYNIEKPKTPEEIEKYRQTLQARFKELPEEYKSSVEDIMKVLDNPEALEIAANSFGVDTKNYPDQNVRFQRTQELFKGMDEMPIQGNVYNPINRVFQSLSEKYPEKKSSFVKMQSLMKEHSDILTENNLYKQAQAVYKDPKKIENLFSYSKTGGSFDEPNMNLENGWSNASAGKKLVELGVLTEEDLQNKLNSFLKQAEDNDPYLVNMKRFPKEYEERVNKFKKEFGILV
jgi:lysozyme family protein